LVQKVQNAKEFRIIGKVLAADLDAEGNLHVALRNSNAFWAETAANRLRQLKGRVLKLDVNEWEPKQPRKEKTEDQDSQDNPKQTS
jgi:hypothetical protein